MKKTITILSVLVLIAGSCGQNNVEFTRVGEGKVPSKRIVDDPKNASNAAQHEDDFTLYNCVIPNEVINYLSVHSADFEFVNIKEEMRTIVELLDPTKCPISCVGDFNQNGKEDFAIILRYKGYKYPSLPDHIFPFLVVFNDYKEELKPFIVYKTGGYKNEPIKTVIYEQNAEERDMNTFIKKDEVCNKDVITIKIPEKSSFFVYWNNQTSQYEFLNYMDEDICGSVNSQNIESTNLSESVLPIPEKWYGTYSVTINEDHEDWRDMTDIQLRIDNDTVTFKAWGYMTDLYYLLNVKENENKLHFTYSKTIDANVESAVLKKTKDFGTLTFDGKNYLWTCPYIYIVYDYDKKETYILKKE